MKNSNDIMGNRTRDLPVCSAVPQPTAPAVSLLNLIGMQFSQYITGLFFFFVSKEEFKITMAEKFTNISTDVAALYVHHHVHNSLLQIHILSQINPLYALLSYSSEIHFNIILPSKPKTSKHFSLILGDIVSLYFYLCLFLTYFYSNNKLFPLDSVPKQCTPPSPHMLLAASLPFSLM